MSRLTVRNKIRTELQTWAVANGIEYYDTIDESLKVNDDVWCTAEFFAEFTEKLCYHTSNMRESGTIDVSVFIRAGQGDNTAVTFCDAIQDYFFNLDMGEVEIIDTVSASEINAGDSSGKYYGCSVSLIYNYYY